MKDESKKPSAGVTWYEVVIFIVVAATVAYLVFVNLEPSDPRFGGPGY